jgi:hypothetical protein
MPATEFTPISHVRLDTYAEGETGVASAGSRTGSFWVPALSPTPFVFSKRFYAAYTGPRDLAAPESNRRASPQTSATFFGAGEVVSVV